MFSFLKDLFGMGSAGIAVASNYIEMAEDHSATALIESKKENLDRLKKAGVTTDIIDEFEELKAVLNRKR